MDAILKSVNITPKADVVIQTEEERRKLHAFYDRQRLAGVQQPVSGPGRQRREFRGDRRRPKLDVTQVDAWKQPYTEAFARANRTVCAAMVREYGARVRRFGYSLLDVSRVDITEALRHVYALRGNDQ